MRFLLKSIFWLGLAFMVIQAPAIDLAGSARQVGATAVETGRAAALDGIGRLTCDSLECAGAKFVAQSALKPADSLPKPVAEAPYPSPPLRRSAL